MLFNHTNSGVCSKSVSFELEDGKVSNIKFAGGCPGNLAAIAKLCEGMDAQFVIDKLKGNTCGPKPTSCGDQLADGLEKALAYMASHKE